MSRFDIDKSVPGEWEGGLGIHPTTWPDSKRQGFEWDCGRTTVRTQDWWVGADAIANRRYRVPTLVQIPEKFVVVRPNPAALKSPVEGQTKAPLDMSRSVLEDPPFTLTFSSASYFPLSPPAIIAKGFGWPAWGLGIEGVNSRLMRWLLERLADEERVRGCVAMDFYREIGGDESLAEILVMMNFMSACCHEHSQAAGYMRDDHLAVALHNTILQSPPVRPAYTSSRKCTPPRPSQILMPVQHSQSQAHQLWLATPGSFPHPSTPAITTPKSPSCPPNPLLHMRPNS